jgi:hypothetical protein
MSVMEAVVGSLREGMVGAISGGVSGSTMIIPCMPFESIMTFQAAGDMPGKPSMMEVATELYRCAPSKIPRHHARLRLRCTRTHRCWLASSAQPAPLAPLPPPPARCRRGGIKRFFKGLGVIWVTVLTEKGGLFFWYAVLKALWGRYAGIPSSAVAGIPALFCGWGAENLAIPTRYPFEVVLRDMQTSTRKEGIPATVRRIYKHEGLLGFYKGSYVYLLYGFRSGIQQSMYDQMRVMRLASLAARGVMLSELSFGTAFFYAGVGRFVATLLTYPLMRAKVMAISEQGQKLGLIGCLRCVRAFPSMQSTSAESGAETESICRRPARSGRPGLTWSDGVAGCVALQGDGGGRDGRHVPRDGG